METITNTQTTPLPQAQPTTDLGHEKLLSCLYFLWDAFERTGLKFFLVKDTAKNAINEHMLEGDHIDIGVRLNEWLNDDKDILYTYFTSEHVQEISNLPDKVTLKWSDVPFTIHIYPDNPCITAPIPVVYEHESWLIPNMFETFEKEYDK